MKTIGSVLSSVCLLLLLSVSAHAGLKPVALDVVMEGGELFFVLEKAREIEGIYVTLQLPPLEALAEAGKKENKRRPVMWAVEYVPAPGEKKKRFPKLSQIRYARKSPGLVTTEGPVKLRKNVKYHVHLEIYGREFADEIFVINDDGKVDQKTRRQPRSYTLSTDKSGNKVLVPSPKK